MEEWNIGMLECCGVSRNPASAGEEGKIGKME